MIHLAISEYGYIYHHRPNNLNNKFIHTKVEKEQLKELIKYWQKDKNIRDALEYDGANLKAKNYVGVIQTQNISIEILPKIFDGNDTQNIRDIFISMLKVVLNINELQINKADIGTTKNKNIFEIFIALFISSVDSLIKKGIKSDYISQEKNSNFLKGKLKINEQLKQNYIHKERFFVQFDEYLQDRAENRLLKSTIKLLLQKTKNYENKKALRTQLFIFDNVQTSKNIDKDIVKINLYRGMEYYEVPLKFAKLFLKDKSFTSLSGKDNVFALLFPMQKLFEEYLAIVLNNSKNELGADKVLINGGKNEYFLSGNNARLEPDYLLKMKNSKDIIVDAKWKIVDEILSSNDIYQIFSYLNFYDCNNTAYLFVPQNNNLQDELNFDYQQLIGTSNKKLKVIFINLKETIKNHKLKENFLCNS
jgi:5-methylcytosine-specific restriction enzyme subunit McrC